MAEITRANVSLTSMLPNADQLLTVKAGEALAAGDACYLKNDGKAWKSSGAAATAAAKVRGYALTAKPVGEAITLATDVRLNYATGLTPGADLFLSGTVAGGLADAASTGGTAPVGFVIDATRVHVWQSRY